MDRVKFENGKQRGFLKNVLGNTNCPSLRELNRRGFDIPYSTLKNYFCEVRLIPKNLLLDLCKFSGINPRKLKIIYLNENWGRIKGGKVCKK